MDPMDTTASLPRFSFFLKNFTPLRIPKDPPMEGWMNLFFTGVNIGPQNGHFWGVRILGLAQEQNCFKKPLEMDRISHMFWWLQLWFSYIYIYILSQTLNGAGIFASIYPLNYPNIRKYIKYIYIYIQHLGISYNIITPLDAKTMKNAGFQPPICDIWVTV